MPSKQLDQILSKLQNVKGKEHQFTARCPAHDDKRNSLSLSEDDDKIVIHCFAGCSPEKIVLSMGITMAELFITDNIVSLANPKIIAEYDYTDAEGNLLYQVVRYHPKNFKQRRPDGDGGWLWNLNGVELTLYHLPEVMQAISEKKLVFIVEGEKDVDNLRTCGQVATSISGGASSKWPPELVPLFQNATVAIIPDNDDPGRKYAHYVANLLYGWASSLKIITLPLKDVSDYLETQTIDNLLNICHNTGKYIPSGAVTRDEFNSWRGVNQYLWQQLLKQKTNRRKSYIYNSIMETP